MTSLLQTYPRLASRYPLVVVVVIAALVVVRLLCAAWIPLAFDEALYWRLSKNLAGGYFDHPPATMFLIRGGTALFGDTEFGVRVLGILLGIPSTWAVWRAAALLFHHDRIGATSALFFNLTLVMSAGSILATPDTPLVAASAFLLASLAQLYATGRGEWWLAVGLAFGFGMLSKYTTVFFAPGILAWVLLVPSQRHWLRTGWPWIAGLIALFLFAPVLIWNAEHGWASFLLHANKVVSQKPSLLNVIDLLLAQTGLATPQIFLLGCMGLFGFLKGRGGPREATALIGALVWSLAIYFILHSLKSRVQGNWLEPAFPPFVVAAAAAVHCMRWQGIWDWFARWSAYLAPPVGVGLAALVYLQALVGIVPIGPSDPTLRALGTGWRALGRQIDELRMGMGAQLVLATDYGLTAWLSFYLPSRPPVQQIDLRMRWVNEPSPDPQLLQRPMIFVCKGQCPQAATFRARFDTFEPITTVARSRHGVAIERYTIFRVEGARGDPLDPPAPPPVVIR